MAATFLYAESALAKTVVVVKPGSLHCEPSVLGVTYTTIQAAIDALPSGAPTATHKVIICPGVYEEQIRIAKTVTVQGVLRDGTDPETMDGNRQQVTIVPPAGGWVVLDPADTVAAGVLITGVDDANLTNVTVDGTAGIGCPLGGDGNPIRTAGIAIENSGVVDTSKRVTVNKNVVRNLTGMCNGNPSFSAEGILALNSWYTVDTNSISNVDLSPVRQIGGIGKILNNWMNEGWHGVRVSDSTATTISTNTGTTVSGNTVSSFTTGVFVDHSGHVLVSNNTLTNWTGSGIAVIGPEASDNIITGNKISDAWHGIYLSSGPARTTVRNNTIVRSVKVGIVDWFGEGGNVIQNNTIIQAPWGVWTHAPLDDVINPNTFFNVDTLNGSGLNVPQ